MTSSPRVGWLLVDCSLWLFCYVVLLLLLLMMIVSRLCSWLQFHRSNKLETFHTFICYGGETEMWFQCTCGSVASSAFTFHCTGCLTLSARISQKRYAGLIGANCTVPFVGTYADRPLGCWRHYFFLPVHSSEHACVCSCIHAYVCVWMLTCVASEGILWPTWYRLLVYQAYSRHQQILVNLLLTWLTGMLWSLSNCQLLW